MVIQINDEVAINSDNIAKILMTKGYAYKETPEEILTLIRKEKSNKKYYKYKMMFSIYRKIEYSNLTSAESFVSMFMLKNQHWNKGLTIFDNATQYTLSNIGIKEEAPVYSGRVYTDDRQIHNINYIFGTPKLFWNYVEENYKIQCLKEYEVPASIQ